jgi:stage V sporulation protein D (sporulation-specific penicillin-binding protein)
MVIAWADLQKRKSGAARKANQIIRSRTVLMMLLFGVATFAILLMKLYNLQIVKHEKLQEEAVAQQTRSTVVSASRGTIYDKNGNVLAVSASAETVFLSPKEIAENKKESASEIARGTCADSGR